MWRPWLLVPALVAACSPSAVPIDAASLGAAAIARARTWVDARVPYCQAINHVHDVDPSCAVTCTRPDNAEWNPYRSDCSGFVSWAWGLPPVGGGRTTVGLAPFQTDVSHEIAAADLEPGDALNNATHILLFEAWVVPGVSARFMEEPGCGSATPYAHELTANVTLIGNIVVVESRGAFTAIRPS